MAGAGIGARARYRARLAIVRARERLPERVWVALVRAVDALDPVKRVAWRLRRGGPPVPRAQLRRRVGSRGIAEHVGVGSRSAESVISIFDRAGHPLGPGDRVLDWGCGSGRVAMQLLARTDVDLHGCDVDPDAIGWLRGAVPDGERRFRVSRFFPPLPYEDGGFDRIYAISVFTHLNERDQLTWLRELARLLRPGGAALLTTAGARAFENPVWAGMPPGTAEELAAARGRLDELGFVFASYSDRAERPDKWPGISGEYGLAYQTEEWTCGHWARELEVAEVIPAGVDGYQDAVVAVRAG